MPFPSYFGPVECTLPIWYRIPMTRFPLRPAHPPVMLNVVEGIMEGAWKVARWEWYQRHSWASLWLVFVLLAVPLAVYSVVTVSPARSAPSNEIVLTITDNGSEVILDEDTLLVVRLPANPSTGYLWEVVRADLSLIVQKQDGMPEFEVFSEVPGSSARQVLRFAAIAEGETELALALRRPWESTASPLSTFSVVVRTVGPFTGANFPTPPPQPSPTPTVEIAVADVTALGLPTHFNWCEQGKCTPIKDQGPCGSCWAFATTGVLEAAIKIHDGAERDLSEQYLLSCNTRGWGCTGGFWAHDYHYNEIPPGETEAGAVYEQDFPYRAQKIACGAPHPHHERIFSWGLVAGYGMPSVLALKQAIYNHGPVTAGVCVGNAFANYTGGIFQTDERNQCPYGTNHAVVLVGWDDSQGVWYLRNSWGMRWGENGMMRIKYGVSLVGEDASYIEYGQGTTDSSQADDSKKIFLPFVARYGGAQPPQPEPQPQPPALTVPANGGFEDGPTAWSEFSQQGWRIVLDRSHLTVAPHNGSWAVWLGGDNDEVSYIQQEVTVPVDRPQLTYWYWINSADTCGADRSSLIVDGRVIESYYLCATRNTGGWVQRIVDLSAYRGRTAELQLRVETDSSGISNLYIDDIWFQTLPVAESGSPVGGVIVEVTAKSTLFPSR